MTQHLCMGCFAHAGLLAKHVEDVLELGEVVLPYLTTDARATLLAVARRRVRSPCRTAPHVALGCNATSLQ